LWSGVVQKRRPKTETTRKKGGTGAPGGGGRGRWGTALDGVLKKCDQGGGKRM